MTLPLKSSRNEQRFVIGFLWAEKNYTVSQKNIPDIFNCNLKTNYRILIIFGRNIPDTTCHQMTIYFFTSPNVCFCTT